jgi:6-phosphogluconate dehydrogenase
MQIGVIGLGRMGGNIVRRLLRAGHACVVYDADAAPGAALAKEGATVASSVPALVEALGSGARTVWVMLPAGRITEETVRQLGELMRAGDVIIDGGNTNFKDDVRRARELAPKGIKYLDVGTSGGVWGLARGYCLMIGGDADEVRRLDPIFAALAPGQGAIERTAERADAPAGQVLDPRAEQGYLHAGPVGAGHFVKMIHNGIEYGMMQAFAEGFDIMRNRASTRLPADERYDLNLADIAEVWRRGSVVTSWLLDLTASALAKDAALEHFSGRVEDSGEGRWTIEAAIEEAVPADVLAASLFVRFRSRQDHTFAEKVLSAMRLGFGGHVEAPKK